MLQWIFRTAPLLPQITMNHYVHAVMSQRVRDRQQSGAVKLLTVRLAGVHAGGGSALLIRTAIVPFGALERDTLIDGDTFNKACNLGIVVHGIQRSDSVYIQMRWSAGTYQLASFASSQNFAEPLLMLG